MNYDRVIERIARIHDAAQSVAARSVNQWLTFRNWLIGAYIFEYEQNGEDRSAYGNKLLATLAADLSRRGQKGLSPTNLKYFREFALAYPLPGIGQALSDQFSPLVTKLGVEEEGLLPASNKTKVLQSLQFPALEARHAQNPSLPWQDDAYYSRLFSALPWSHLLELSRLDNPLKRAFYELESMKSGWSLRELKRQMNSMLYERVGLSKDKEAVMALANEGRWVESPATILRDPYVLEFLGLETRSKYSESELEQALIDHLQEFLHELGRDFCFIERQLRITVAGRHHYLDLLFYHRSLRCLIGIDLKLGEFQHEDAGQMNFYLNYLKQEIAHPDENPPVGIILCAEKDAAEVHFATAGMDQQLFISRYLVALPSEERLKQWLRDEQAQLYRLLNPKKDSQP